MIISCDVFWLAFSKFPGRVLVGLQSSIFHVLNILFSELCVSLTLSTGYHCLLQWCHCPSHLNIFIRPVPGKELAEAIQVGSPVGAWAWMTFVKQFGDSFECIWNLYVFYLNNHIFNLPQGGDQRHVSLCMQRPQTHCHFPNLETEEMSNDRALLSQLCPWKKNLKETCTGNNLH